MDPAPHLSGANIYTGGTYINSGLVAVSVDNNLGGNGTITLNGGTLQYAAPGGNGHNLTLSSGHILNIGRSGGTIYDTSTTYNSGIYLGTANQLTGSGTLTLTGASNANATDELNVNAVQNTFTGNIVVNSGRLEINTSNAGSVATPILGNGTVTINSGATLGIFAGGFTQGGNDTITNTVYLAGTGDGHSARSVTVRCPVQQTR